MQAEPLEFLGRGKWPGYATCKRVRGVWVVAGWDGTGEPFSRDYPGHDGVERAVRAAKRLADGALPELGARHGDTHVGLAPVVILRKAI